MEAKPPPNTLADPEPSSLNIFYKTLHIRQIIEKRNKPQSTRFRLKKALYRAFCCWDAGRHDRITPKTGRYSQDASAWRDILRK